MTTVQQAADLAYPDMTYDCAYSQVYIFLRLILFFKEVRTSYI